MRCGICNFSSMEQTTTTIEEWDGDELIVIEDVAVERCPQCRAEYFAPEILEELETLLDRRHDETALQPTAVLQVPVFKFALAI